MNLNYWSKLPIFRGKAEEVLQKLIDDTKATNVLWNRRYEPWAVKRDRLIKENSQPNHKCYEL